MDPDEELKRRLAQLEGTVAFQERALGQLDEVLREVAGQAEHLAREVARLERRLRDLEQAGAEAGDEAGA